MTTNFFTDFFHGKLLLVFLLILSLSLLFFPKLIVILLSVSGLFTILVLMYQFGTFFVPRRNHPVVIGSYEPFVSIHVACHNEPPRIVKKTLKSLANLNYDHFEVIVLDNNTSDETLWRPLEAYCKDLGPKFRFFHVENLPGFKAGALNRAMQYMDPRSEIIAIVDADYVVKPDFLREGVSYFRDPVVALVQYPQDYLNTAAGNQGIDRDYSSYFNCFMEQANALGAATFTGTMGLLRASLFPKQLRWNEWCITEDTEVGIQLCNLGYKGIFINKSQGQGLMPLDYYSLRRQRERWSYGNMQILLKDFWPVLFNKHLNWKQKWSFFALLSAWFHPNFFPFISLIVALIVSIFLPTYRFLDVIIALSLGTLLFFFLAKSIYLLLSLIKEKKFSWNVFLATVVAHFGLTGIMSTAWLYAVLHKKLPYNRTNKDPDELAPTIIPTEVFWGISLLFVTLTAFLAQSITSFYFLGSCTYALILLISSAGLHYQLSTTRHLTKKFNLSVL